MDPALGVILELALGDDAVDRHRGLAGLAVADDQLALTSADRGHRVDRFDARLERLVDALSFDDPWGLELNGAEVFGLDGIAAVDGLAEGVHDAADEGFADGDAGDLLGAFDEIALADQCVAPEEGDADVILFQVEDHALDTLGEVEELSGHGPVEAVDACDAIADGEHRARLEDSDLLIVALDLLADDFRDLFSANFHGCSLIPWRSASVGSSRRSAIRKAASCSESCWRDKAC